MKLIIKGVEPSEWKAKRETHDRGKFEAIPQLRQSLFRDQGGICAYCMQKLEVESSHPQNREYRTVGGNSHEIVKNKVEHIITQSESKRLDQPNNDFDYNNMLLCCNGRTKYIGDEHVHCDTKRSNQVLTLSPLRPDFINTISYHSDGFIDSSNTVWKNEMDVVLNLNCTVLVANRKRVLSAIKTKLTGYSKRTKRVKNVSWSTRDIETELNSWGDKDANGFLKPYCGIVTSYLTKKIKGR